MCIRDRFGRTGDSDQTTGHFAAMALLDQVIGTSYLSRTWIDGERGPLPMGGLTATGANFLSVRNTINLYYSRLAEGGVCAESSAYCIGTLQFINFEHGIFTAAVIHYF